MFRLRLFFLSFLFPGQGDPASVDVVGIRNLTLRFRPDQLHRFGLCFLGELVAATTDSSVGPSTG